MSSHIVDAHFHLWDLDKLIYKWPRKNEEEAIYRNFVVNDYLVERKQTAITHSIFVEAHNSIKETEWILKVAEDNDFIAGVVGFVSLQSRDKLRKELDRFTNNTKLVGCRRILDFEEEGWLTLDLVNDGLKILQEYDLVFELLIKERDFKDAEYCVQQNPKLKFIVDHIAKPNIKNGGSKEWFDGISKLATYPNVYCKLSGLVTEADLDKWLPSDFEKYAKHVLKEFGVDRIIFGSDWPVCKMAHVNLKDIYNLCNKLIADLPDEAKAKIFGLNAMKFYNLNF